MDGRTLRNEFAKQNFGLTGFANPSGIDCAQMLPPMMHRGFIILASICIRVGHVGKNILKNKNQWISKLSKVVGKIDVNRHQIKFDEIGYKAFWDKVDNLLVESNFSDLLLDILRLLFDGLQQFMPSLMNLKRNCSPENFEMKTRCFLGWSVVFIFGSRLMTATMKQVIAYTRWYIQQGKNDYDVAGLDIGLGSFSDSVHKRSKQGN